MLLGEKLALYATGLGDVGWGSGLPGSAQRGGNWVPCAVSERELPSSLARRQQRPPGGVGNPPDNPGF